MFITKYGDLTKKDALYQIDFKCPICETEGVLEKGDYTLEDKLYVYVKGEDKYYGDKIKYTCPMCETEHEVNHIKVSKIKYKWWFSEFSEWDYDDFFLWGVIAGSCILLISVIIGIAFSPDLIDNEENPSSYSENVGENTE